MQRWYLVGIVFVITVGIVLLSGCVYQPADNTSEQNATPPVMVMNKTIPNATATPSQRYQSANITIKPETKPATSAFGFRMDYPSDWSSTKDRALDWNAVYNFSSPDAESQVFVYVANAAGSAIYIDPLMTWTDDTVTDLTQPYCHDGAGNRITCSPTEPGSAYHNLTLVSNAPVNISGSTEARRLIFASNDDTTFGRETVYLIYAGKMKGFNFTVPYHYETAVKVNGRAWDYGMGGMRYMITFYAPPDQVNATADIFRHMINSFKITK